MLVKEKELIEHLRSVQASDWEKLFNLIPRVEQATSFGIWNTSNNTFPYVIHSEEVKDFLAIVDDLGLIVVFDWGKWTKGYDAWGQKNYDFHSMSLPELCKMLTLLVRGDRFNEGLLVEAFQRGLVLRMLKAIKAKTPFSGE